MKVLYICTHNRCRSILSEAITNHFSAGKIEARSAGSQPSGEVHPLSLKYLTEAGISIKGLKSESWDGFEEFSPDLVVTVCDSAANESCPVWFGKAVKVHWGLVDPSKLDGTDEEKGVAFRNTIEEVKERVVSLMEIDFSELNQKQQRDALTTLGAI